MNDSFETEGLRYLLNEMDAGSRAAFEARLERDSAGRVALKSCADAIARFAADEAPAEPMSATDQQEALNAILAKADPIQAMESPRTAKTVRRWTNAVWPIAAAVLLMLNLIDFRRPVPAGENAPLAGQDQQAMAGDVAGSVAGTDGVVDRSTAADLKDRSSAVGTGKSGADGDSRIAAKMAAELAETSRELDQLREDHAELQRTTASLRDEYDAVVRNWAARVAFDRSVGRLAAMEMVDAESYARGDRKGLVEVARAVLTEPGVIVATAGPMTPGVEPPGTAGGDSPSAVAAPYAWAVFDDDEQRGYLNLYNLPNVPRSEALQLWVRAIDRTDFQRVGEVPAAFYGGSGSVQYRLADGQAPAEIMVTREPRGNVVQQPAGPTVLRGP